MKRVFALCAVILMIVVGVMPTFAETWAKESPVYGSTNAVWKGYQGDAQYSELRLQVQDAVWKAYELGMFGGLYPVAVFYRSGADNTFIIQVMTPMGATDGTMTTPGYNAENGTAKFNGYAASAYSGGTKYNDRVYLTNTTAAQSARQPFVMWTLRQSGDWTPSWTGSSANYVPLSSNAWPTSTAGTTKLVSMLNPASEQFWFDSSAWGSSYKAGWVTGGTIQGNTLSSIISRYDEQLALLEYVPPEPTPPSVSYQLDIPSIFDGYFNGVRNVLSAFDINLFGINIIGVLIAFIVIAVVAFIVRKLWK